MVIGDVGERGGTLLQIGISLGREADGELHHRPGQSYGAAAVRIR